MSSKIFYFEKENQQHWWPASWESSWCCVIVWLIVLRAVRDPEDLEARSSMHLASVFAGIGFGNAGVHLWWRPIVVQLQHFSADSLSDWALVRFCFTKLLSSALRSHGMSYPIAGNVKTHTAKGYCVEHPLVVSSDPGTRHTLAIKSMQFT